jgi:hypothetical protein
MLGRIRRQGHDSEDELNEDEEDELGLEDGEEDFFFFASSICNAGHGGSPRAEGTSMSS